MALAVMHNYAPKQYKVAKVRISLFIVLNKYFAVQEYSRTSVLRSRRRKVKCEKEDPTQFEYLQHRVLFAVSENKVLKTIFTFKLISLA